jgi:putative endonuclease
MKSYYVYMLTNSGNRVLYIGVTNNLDRRIFEHQSKLIDGFTKQYNCNKLVYYEETSSVVDAIAREKQFKGWVRRKKDKMIEQMNPTWKNLFED